MLEEYEDEKLDGIIAQLSEFFPNYAIAVLSEDDGSLHYDYSNWRIGRMLLRDSLADMEEGLDMSIAWDQYDIEDEDEDGDFDDE